VERGSGGTYLMSMVADQSMLLPRAGGLEDCSSTDSSMRSACCSRILFLCAAAPLAGWLLLSFGFLAITFPLAPLALVSLAWVASASAVSQSREGSGSRPTEESDPGPWLWESSASLPPSVPFFSLTLLSKCFLFPTAPLILDS
jgi:hypothetical protein